MMEVNEWFVHHKNDRLKRKDILNNNIGRGKEVIACNIRRDADAHKISAVNELYDALEYMLACHRDMHDKECEKARVMSLAALAKARGGPNAS